MSPRYECDQCGACCQGHLIVEAGLLDALREPRLLDADPQYAALPQHQALVLLEDEWRCLIVAGGATRSCPFLGEEKRCSIYPTRPNVCVAFQAGDEQCQQAREAGGLTPLQLVARP